MHQSNVGTRAITKKSGTVRAVQLPVAHSRVAALQPQHALALPLAFLLVLAAFGFLPSAQQNPRLLWSFWGAAAVLLVWDLGLLAVARHRSRMFGLEIVLRKQHYLQACAQGSVLLYWGWYWREVYNSAHLILAQLVFVYAFDILLAWSRRETYTLGFGPFPVVFSTNLFLWFKPNWFYLQFLMLALGFAAKELIRWNKDGRRTHIFNPSSFPLGVFSLGLILTGTTNRTWGQEIATTLNQAPHIYLWIFLIGLPGQFLFGVTTMTMSAVLTTYAFGLWYFSVTGTYFFIDSYIPIAVFLGMHLLFTDPSTSPRTELGRIMFGVLYGFSVIVLTTLLAAFGAPTFYDKLLAVPILNMMIKGIDWVARLKVLRFVDPAKLGSGLAPRSRNLVYMSVWILVFGMMSAAEGVGDEHPGRRLPFWQQACREGRTNGCRVLAGIEAIYCRQGSGWACNDLGILLTQVRNDGMRSAAERFEQSCSLGFEAGCVNVALTRTGAKGLQNPPPKLEDYFIVLQEGKGPLPPDTPAHEVYERACQQGWAAGCSSLQLLQSRSE